MKALLRFRRWLSLRWLRLKRSDGKLDGQLKSTAALRTKQSRPNAAPICLAKVYEKQGKKKETGDHSSTL
jgi:hypothetical protein